MICIRKGIMIFQEMTLDKQWGSKNFKVIAVGVILFFSLTLSQSSLIQAQGISPIRTADNTDDPVVDKDENGALYLDFKKVTLINVLNSLAEVSDINFVAGNEIASREVNMTLDGVTLQQALEAISQGSNVTYDFMPNTNIITFRASSDSALLAPLFTRVFKLYFLRATKIEEINAGASSGGGSGGGGLALVSGGKGAAGSQEKENLILNVIEKMLSERGSVAVDARSNSLIVTDSGDRLDRVAAVVAELDRPLSQILINVLLVETFEDLDRQLGIEWAFSSTADSDGLLGTIQGGISDTRFPFNNGNADKFGLGSLLKADPFPPVASGDAVLGTKNFESLNVRAKALQTASKLRILAKPNILVMDNHPAIIKIVTDAAIGERTVVTGDTAGGAGSSSSETERAEVGTILRVTPQINTQNQVTMTIEPTFATVAQSTIAAAGTGDPTIRAARTTMMVNSGSTMVMGGLMFSEQSDGERKVPFLGDLPLIGRAFTKEDKSISDRELVLFITPQIVKNPANLESQSVPDRNDRFDDVKAQFWKYRKKSWYKDVAQGGPKSDVPFESYFKVRENVMDKAAITLQGQKESAMKSEVHTVGNVTSASEGVKL